MPKDKGKRGKAGKGSNRALLDRLSKVSKDVEKGAARIHQKWIRNNIRQGIYSRRAEWGEELMRPYHKLSPRAQELNRSMLRESLRISIRMLERILDEW